MRFKIQCTILNVRTYNNIYLYIHCVSHKIYTCLFRLHICNSYIYILYILCIGSFIWGKRAWGARVKDELLLASPLYTKSQTL